MIQLTLTEDQARLVGMACEFYARIRMGQFGEIPFRCAEKHCPKDPEATKRAWLELRKHIYPDLCGIGHSYGIGKFDDADRAFDVYQVIRYAMGGQPPFSYHELPKCERIGDSPTVAAVPMEAYNELCEMFMDYACSGVSNLAPFCENVCPECLNSYGWCSNGENEACKGFVPMGRSKYNEKL